MVRRLRASRPPSWLRLGLAAAGWTLATVVGVSVIGLLTSDVSWLGASDERVASVAVETYGAFLRQVAWAIVELALMEWALLSVVTFGLLVLTTTTRDHRESRRAFVHATRFALALLVTL